jgi:hypothetical protein
VCAHKAANVLGPLFPAAGAAKRTLDPKIQDSSSGGPTNKAISTIALGRLFRRGLLESRSLSRTRSFGPSRQAVIIPLSDEHFWTRLFSAVPGFESRAH